MKYFATAFIACALTYAAYRLDRRMCRHDCTWLCPEDCDG